MKPCNDTCSTGPRSTESPWTRHPAGPGNRRAGSPCRAVAFRSDRNPAFREILKVIFGILPGVATREQLAQEHFTRFQATQEIDATKIRELKRIFHAYVLDGDVRRLIEAGDYATLRTHDAGVYQSLKAIGPDGLKPLLDYIKANVPLDDLVRVA